MPGEMISVAELAREWGWSIERLYRLVKQDAIPYIRFGPTKRSVFFERTQLNAWLAERRVTPAAPARPTAAARSLEDEFKALGTTREESGMFVS